MSRSSEQGRAPVVPRRWVLTSIAAAALSWTSAPPARADQVIAVPEPFDLNGARPQVSPIRAVVEDLAGIATESAGTSGYDMRLHASVAFAKDSAVLLPGARSRLAQVVGSLRSRPQGAITVTGYTDDLGSAEHGLVLSRQRAEAVRAVLVAGLPGRTVTASGKGEADPLVPNTSEVNRSKNRRVEIHCS